MENKLNIIEALLFAAQEPINIKDLFIFIKDDGFSEKDILFFIDELAKRLASTSLELVKVASGYRIQIKKEYMPWIMRLKDSEAPRVSRSLLETLSIIAYQQPITRAEIEEIRGVSLSSSVLKQLQDYDWVRKIGYKELPGRPPTYGTTKKFLDDFNLVDLSDLPAMKLEKVIKSEEE